LRRTEATQFRLDLATLDRLGDKTVIFGVINMATRSRKRRGPSPHSITCRRSG
jgi:hypothetical protein